MPNLLRLLNETYRESYEFIPCTEDGIHSWIQEGTLKILIAEEKGEILGSAAYDDGHWGEEIEWLTVLERPNRKIIETDLVGEIEKCVDGRKVFMGVDAEGSKINEWAERGYKPEDGLYHMVARLDGLKPLPKTPESVTIRSLKPNEEKEFVRKVNAGFGGEKVKLDVKSMRKTISQQG